MKTPPIVIVAAIGKDRALGKEGKLLWHIPEDLKRFRRLTSGHPIIMGRKTFESIVGYVGGPLPGRTNVVMTRDTSWQHEGVVVKHSLEDALKYARSLDPQEIHIGGGADLYAQVMPQVDKLYLTLVDDEKEADAFFPPYEKEFTTVVHEEAHEWNGIKYRWVDLER
ncbi:MAG: dihydrofolate reductase [Candidatus Kaiserbacteria bacterium]|nr:dihydrofolate reductase [Candidatus Kaiserbacteria bacterium]